MNPNLINDKKVIITCGSGGVGKTTLSAAIAVYGTLKGKKTCVVTIDPAKRLANALGLNFLSTSPTRLTEQLRDIYANLFKKYQPLLEWKSGGELFAIAPDTSKTFETLVSQLTTHRDQVENILKNPIFKIFSQEFSGSNEYMAMELLYQLHSSREYDFIVLDTPPSNNTLDFFDAPRLLSRFFDERIFRWLAVPVNKLFSSGIKKALEILEKLTGNGFIGQLVDFSESLFQIEPKFSTNLKHIIEMLESSDVGFMMVSVPSQDLLKETERVIIEIQKRNIHFEGIFLNRSLLDLESQFSPSIIGSNSAYSLLRELQKREQEMTKSKMLSNATPVIRIPEMTKDPHSLESLIFLATFIERTLTDTYHRR